MGVGDIISQQVIERRGLTKHSIRRTAKMMSTGFLFVVCKKNCFLMFQINLHVQEICKALKNDGLIIV